MDKSPEYVKFTVLATEFEGEIVSKNKEAGLVYIKEKETGYQYSVLWDNVQDFASPIPKECIAEKKCECGLDFAPNGGRHSDWCPMYKES